MKAHPHSGEHLEVLGKSAAALYTSGACMTLSSAVLQTVKLAQLAPEQVRRVVEFANTAAYLTAFRKEGSPHKVIDFPGGPADVSEILKDLNDGGGGSVFDRGTLDYASPPEGAKTASAEDDQALAAAFQVEGGGRELPYADPLREAEDLKDKLAGAADHLHAQLSGLEVMYAELGDRLYQQVKQAALEGLPLGEIARAWATVSPGNEYLKVAFSLLTPRLLRDGVFADVGAMSRSVDKMASVGRVNEAHPLVGEFVEFCEALAKLAETRAAHEELTVHHARLETYLKQASLIGGVLRGAERAGEAARPLLHSLGGPTVADLGAKAIKYSPYAAGAIGASELATHIDNSPSAPARAIRASKKLVLQNIPGTQERLQHKYEIQSGQ